MSRKGKVIILLLVALVILSICTIFEVLNHRESIFASRKINGSIDIGGYKLNVNCYGKGKPTVIFESGFGTPKEYWCKVQPQISQITRTFSYDKAGVGLSDPRKLKNSSLNQVYELHTLLKNTKVKGPYIIVAHSLGGFNARLFAGLYPKEVAGIVFVDCSHEDQNEDMLKHLTSNEIESMRSEYKDSELTFDEMLLSDKQVKEIRKKDTLRNIPIIVLTADHNGEEFYVGENKAWVNFQNDIASLSNKSKHIFVKDCSHFIQTDQPQVVINAIKDIIKEVKK